MGKRNRPPASTPTPSTPMCPHPNVFYINPNVKYGKLKTPPAPALPTPSIPTCPHPNVFCIGEVLTSKDIFDVSSKEQNQSKMTRWSENMNQNLGNTLKGSGDEILSVATNEAIVSMGVDPVDISSVAGTNGSTKDNDIIRHTCSKPL